MGQGCGQREGPEPVPNRAPSGPGELGEANEGR